MEITEILADNITRPTDGRNVAQLARGATIAQRTIYKYQRTESAARIDKLAELAEALGMETWMLLVQGLPEDVNALEFSRYVHNYLKLTPKKRAYLAEVSDDTVSIAVRAANVPD